VRLGAIKDLLDRTGFKPTVQVQADTETVIRIVREEQPIAVIEATYAHVNGHTHD
jgi:hypothetical protein